MSGMSDSYYVVFENVAVPINNRLILDIVKLLKSKNFHYNDLFWSDAKGDHIVASIEETIKEILNGGSIGFVRNTGNDINLAYHPDRNPDDLRIESDFVNFNNSIFVDVFIELIKYLHLKFNSNRVYGRFYYYTEFEKTYLELIKRDDYVSCFNIFNPQTVNKIGKEKLISLEAYKKEQLKDGSFLLVLSRNPIDCSHEKLEEIRRFLFR